MLAIVRACAAVGLDEGASRPTTDFKQRTCAAAIKNSRLQFPNRLLYPIVFRSTERPPHKSNFCTSLTVAYYLQ